MGRPMETKWWHKSFMIQMCSFLLWETKLRKKKYINPRTKQSARLKTKNRIFQKWLVNNIMQQRLFLIISLLINKNNQMQKIFMITWTGSISAPWNLFPPLNNSFANKKWFAHMTRFRAICLSRKIIPMLQICFPKFIST